MKIEVVNAERKHADFIVHANQMINDTNNVEQTNRLAESLEKDYFIEKPKFSCLIAEQDGKPVGMILYSKVYWADDGEVLWISQMYVEETYRKNGIFFELIKALKKENPDIEIVSCATGGVNKKMQKILKYYGAKEIDLKFYYKIVEK